MSAEENKAIARRFCEGQDLHKGPPPADLCAPNYTAHIVGFPSMDLAGHAELAKGFYVAFPNLKHIIDDAVAEGDKAVIRFSLRGTHQGEFMGVAPTNKEVEIAGVAIFRMVGGKVSELWETFDRLGLMQQLGVIPPPGE
ncbi:MAG: ester cyclase [Chloroflexi bacterium]|nr:ester cyclase [Chloroflexota bacterium]